MLCASPGTPSRLWGRAAGDGRWINVLDLEQLRRIRANTPEEFGILNQRHAVGWDYLFQFWQPRAGRQLIGEVLLQYADRNERGCGSAWRGSQEGNERAIRRTDKFSSKLQQATALDVGLDGLNALPGDLQLPVFGFCIGEILVQRGQPMALGLQDLSNQVFGEIEIVTRHRQERLDIGRPDRFE